MNEYEEHLKRTAREIIKFQEFLEKTFRESQEKSIEQELTEELNDIGRKPTKPRWSEE